MNVYLLKVFLFCIVFCKIDLCRAELTRTCSSYFVQNCPARKVFDLPDCPKISKKDYNNTLVFAIIGDFGLTGTGCEELVANMVLHEFIFLTFKVEALDKKYGPLDFVLSLGDNGYWSGSCENLDANVGAFYGKYYSSMHGNCVDPTSPNRTEPFFFNSTQP